MRWTSVSIKTAHMSGSGHGVATYSKRYRCTILYTNTY